MRRRTPILAALAVLALGGLGAWATGAQELPVAPAPAPTAGVRFVGTITFGQVVQLAGFVWAVVAFWGRFRVMEQRVHDMWRWFGRQVPDLEREKDGR